MNIFLIIILSCNQNFHNIYHKLILIVYGIIFVSSVCYSITFTLVCCFLLFFQCYSSIFTIRSYVIQWQHTLNQTNILIYPKHSINLIQKLENSHKLFIHFFRLNVKFKNSSLFTLTKYAIALLAGIASLLLLSIVKSSNLDHMSLLACYIIILLCAALIIILHLLIMTSKTLISPTQYIYCSIVYLSIVPCSSRFFVRWNTLFLELNSKKTFAFTLGPIERLTPNSYCTFFFFISAQFFFVLKHSEKIY